MFSAECSSWDELYQPVTVEFCHINLASGFIAFHCSGVPGILVHDKLILCRLPLSKSPRALGVVGLILASNEGNRMFYLAILS